VAGGRSGVLPYLPAIDGLRALAVSAVLVYHAEIGFLGGGFIGVDVFFVISGYLITSLLLAERSATGHARILSFWGRRARRLLPALLALIAGTLLYTVVFLPDEVSSLRGDTLASLGYVSNWYLIFQDQSYFETFGRPSLLRHLWSLAVEEQFYLCFPLIFALVLGRLRARYAIPIVFTGALASAALMAALYEPGVDASRVYYGTDTHIAGILVGSAVAFAWRPGRLPARVTRANSHLADAVGLAALAGLVVISVVATESGAFLYRGGFLAVAVAASLLIAAAVHPGATLISHVLARRPLVWLGTRSYSVYLWHWPVFMLTRPGQDVSMDGAELFALRVLITLAVAELSFRLVEAPVRTGSLRRVWLSIGRVARARVSLGDLRRLGATGAGAGLAVFLAFSIAAADPPPLPPGLEAGHVQTLSWSQKDGMPQRAHRTESPATSASHGAPIEDGAPPIKTTLAPSPAPTVAPANTPAGTLPPTAAPSATAPPLPTPVNGPRVFALGDSVMLGAADALQTSVGNLEIDAAVSRQVAEGISILTSRREAGLLGDVVIVHLGNNGSFSGDQLEEIMAILSGVKRVIFVTVKVPLDWEGPNNGVIESAAAYPNVVIADWKTLGGSHPEIFGDDETHVGPEGAAWYVNLVAPYIATAQ
jgi:peptidoglycan/LPS O-acetylase OafA/YrhL